VSPYRLLVHLNAAILIYGALFWNGLNLVRAPAEATFNEGFAKGMKTARGKMIAILHFIALNIISGVTVAGIDAGKVFNTWPDMNGGYSVDFESFINSFEKIFASWIFEEKSCLEQFL